MKRNKREKGSETWKRMTGKAKRLTALGLTAGLLIGVGAQADAASLKDILMRSIMRILIRI